MIQRKKLSKFNINSVAAMIPVAAAVIAASAVTGACLILRTPEGKEVSDPDNAVKTVLSGTAKDGNTDYIAETNYKGHLSQFPELYEIPFGRTDSYICNKDFFKEHRDVFDEYESDATAFIETLFNVNYREVAADQMGFVADVMQNGDYETLITKNFGSDEEETIYLYDYIEELSEYFIQNQVEMEAKFYTDDSLIYNDFFTFVRGELVFTIYSSEDSESDYKVGEEYQIPVDVAMQRSPSDPSNRTVCSFGKAGDSTFYLTP